jgi:hypothetical protein
MWNQHCEDRLKLMVKGGVREDELERLAQLVVREAPQKGDVAVALQVPFYSDPTGRNSLPPNVIGAVLRWQKGKRVVTTVFMSRMEQFDRGRERSGLQPPEEHFRVDRVVLRGA